jgi:hypothetical protein
MTVFKFTIFYSIDDVPQERYVVAKDSEIARLKIESHFDLLHKEGFAMPCYISDPTVEIDYVI